MRRARRNAHHSAQAFLNKRERAVGHRDGQAAVFASVDDVSGLAGDLLDHVGLDEDAGRDRPVGGRQLQQVDLRGTQRRRRISAQRRADAETARGPQDASI